MSDFVIYYADGSIYRGDNPHDAPANGIQVIVMPNPDGGIMTATKSDYYIYDKRPGDDEPRWYGADIIGLYQYLSKLGLVKFGWHIGNREYKRILGEALKTKF